MIDVKYQKYLGIGDDDKFYILSTTPKNIRKELEDYDAEYYKMYGERFLSSDSDEDDED